MLPVSADFLAESQSQTGNQPALYMDIWPDKGPKRRLTNSNDWSGANDPARSMDVDVSATRLKGSLVLADGAVTSLAGSYVGYANIHRMNYEIKVQDNWHTEGNWFTGTHKVHDYFSYTVLTQEPPVMLSFVATGTFLMSSIRLWVRNFGNSATNVTVRILDANGNQIGKAGSAAVAANITTATMADVSGLAATLRKGALYRIEFGYTAPHAPGRYIVADTRYTTKLEVFSYDVTAQAHRIELGSPSDGFEISGKNGYQATGSAVRTLDVGSIPGANGSITFSDIVPGGADTTSMTITLYYTDSITVAAEATLTNWTLHGVVASGDVIPPHQYWRAKIDMASNSKNDETPELHEMTVTFIGNPLTVTGQVAVDMIPGSPGVYQVTARPGLVSVSTATAQLTSKPSTSMIGRISIELTPEDVINDLVRRKLRGRNIRVRAGYIGVADTLTLYEGIVRDMAYHGGKYTLTATDAISLADVRVPRKKAGPSWANTADYAIGDVAIFGTKSWLTLQASGPGNGGAVTPGTNSLVWQDDGTIWLDIGYTAATNGGVDWHLADIAKDLIINRINIQSQHVDFDSLTALKSRWPGRTGWRVLNKPAKAFEMLSEIAWLLEAQWVVRNSQLTLIPEPSPADSPVESITPDDVAIGVTWRRGWADLKNESLILTGYSGSGNSSASYSGGETVADASSINEYEIVTLDTFFDKWNVPESELTSISANFVSRWSNGRRVIPGCKVSMRLARIDPGDVVMFNAVDLPPGDPGPYKMMILKKDTDWKKQHLNLSLIEVR